MCEGGGRQFMGQYREELHFRSADRCRHARASFVHACRVLVRTPGGNNTAMSHRLVKIDRPILRIPMLAIHLQVTCHPSIRSFHQRLSHSLQTITLSDTPCLTHPIILTFLSTL